jgi:phosphohistidine phosphatase
MIVSQVADKAAEAGISVSQIRHSGKLRARQTAEILARSLKPSRGVVPVPGLQPNDDVDVWAEDLKYEKDNLMLVGHLPFMGRLAGLLVAGRTGANAVKFGPATAVCFSREGSHWHVQWVISPPLA